MGTSSPFTLSKPAIEEGISSSLYSSVVQSNPLKSYEKGPIHPVHFHDRLYRTHLNPF